MTISTLRKLIEVHFNRDEFRELFLDLNLEYENAPNESKIILSHYLVSTCRDRGKLTTLLRVCREKRELVVWPTVEELTQTEENNSLAHSHLPVYKKWVAQQYNVMRLLSMQRPLPLEAVYTDVYLLDNGQYRYFRNDDQQNARLLKTFSKREKDLPSERCSGVEMLEKEKNLFIIGQPGAGKTTFLKWLALRSAQNELAFNKIPVFVELRRLNNKEYSLMDLINKEFIDSGFPKAVAEEFAEYLIRSGNALVLLDGLDEVGQEEGLRAWVNNQIDDLLRISDDSSILITCRPHAEKRQFESFTYMQMAEFTQEQVSDFVSNWFGNEEDKARVLIQELTRTEHKRIQELTRVPLLLALICITYHRDGELPQKRAELYSQAIEVVLSRWDDERGLRRKSVYGQLDTFRKEELLAYIAFHSFDGHSFIFRKNELIEFIQNFWHEWRQVEITRQKKEYGQIFPFELPERDINAVQIITEIIAQHGIFVEQRKDVYSFAHLSFHEYFTARFIIENRAEGTLNTLAKHLTNTRWREVILMTASMLDNADIFFGS